jgi:hypothetical protein
MFLQLAVALGLGLLVGLQRERVDSAVAGIRTFGLITLFGVVCAQLATAFGGWVVVAGLLVVAGCRRRWKVASGWLRRRRLSLDLSFQVGEIAFWERQ